MHCYIYCAPPKLYGGHALNAAVWVDYILDVFSFSGVQQYVLRKCVKVIECLVLYILGAAAVERRFTVQLDSFLSF